jgi:hypothetical protein
MVLMITGCRHPGGDQFDRYHKAVLWRSLNIICKQLNVSRIVVGCAMGVDRWAVEWCKRTGMPYKVYTANWKKYGRAAGHLRNSDMIAVSDKVLAFWDNHSKGTLDAIKKAEEFSKLCTIIPIDKWKKRHYITSKYVPLILKV